MATFFSLMWYFHFKNWIYLYLENPFKTMNKVKGIFRPLKCYFRYGKSWSPILWCSKPSHIQIITRDVGWKDKYNTPRYEQPPYIWIHIFGFNLIWYWDKDFEQKEFVDDYWEQILWYLYYYGNVSYGYLDNPDLEKAKESWPWRDTVTNESSWNDNFLLK